MEETDKAYDFLKRRIDNYNPLSAKTWESFRKVCKFKAIPGKAPLYQTGVVPDSFAFVVKGLVRSYVTNPQGHEYNKNFFMEGEFPGSMASLLTRTPSEVQFETIEDSLVIEINFLGFRKLLQVSQDLMLFHINYLEKNWLLAKDEREIRLVQQEASDRYRALQTEKPELIKRLPLYHIASHLGVTPTQLSRIRKALANKKP